MTRKQANQSIETFSQIEAQEMGAFADEALTEAEALEAQENDDNSEVSYE